MRLLLGGRPALARWCVDNFLCIQIKLTMSVSDFTLNGQIISYLCSIEMYVVSCCCEFPDPTTNGQNTEGDPPAEGSLFDALAALYPTIWTDVTELVRLLEDGAKRGRFKRYTNTDGDEFWYIDLFMLRNNPNNKQYMQFCDAIKDCPRGQSSAPNA